jgi:hypothetical protein
MPGRKIVILTSVAEQIGDELVELAELPQREFDSAIITEDPSNFEMHMMNHGQEIKRTVTNLLKPKH